MIFNMTGGGGNPLNFQVKTYPSETELKADNPKENTIGVITTTTMTSWVFSATEPKEPEVGMVWFNTGNLSNVEFNALKKNTLQVYPIKAKQYVGDKFVDVTSMTSQGGEWHSWRVYLYKAGDQCNDITGGWTAIDGPGGTTNFNATYINCVTDGSNDRYATPYTKNKVNVTNYSKLIAEILERDAETNLFLASAVTGYNMYGSMVATIEASDKGSQTLELDIASITGEYHIGLTAYTPDFDVMNVWME